MSSSIRGLEFFKYAPYHNYSHPVCFQTMIIPTRPQCWIHATVIPRDLLRYRQLQWQVKECSANLPGADNGSDKGWTASNYLRSRNIKPSDSRQLWALPLNKNVTDVTALLYWFTTVLIYLKSLHVPNLRDTTTPVLSLWFIIFKYLIFARFIP